MGRAAHFLSSIYHLPPFLFHLFEDLYSAPTSESFRSSSYWSPHTCRYIYCGYRIHTHIFKESPWWYTVVKMCCPWDLFIEISPPFTKCKQARIKAKKFQKACRIVKGSDGAFQCLLFSLFSSIKA